MTKLWRSAARCFCIWAFVLLLNTVTHSGAAAVSPLPQQPSPAAEPPAPQPSAAVQSLLTEARRQQPQQPQEALKTAEQAVSLARQAGDTAGEARAHWTRGLVLRQIGRTADALAAWQESAAAWQRAGDGPGQVLALSAAGLLVVADKPGEAQSLLARAAAVGRAEVRRSLAAAGALEAAASGCMDLGRPEPAREFWSAAVAVRTGHSPGSLELARDLDQLGRLMRAQGDLAAARADLRQAVELFDRLASGSPELFRSLSTLGSVSHQLGDLAAAGASYRRALALEEKLAPDSTDLGAVVGNVGLVAYAQGDLATARQYLTRAQALYQKRAPDSAALAACLNSLGAVAYAQGDLGTGREFFLEALALQHRLAPGSRDEAMSLNNLGNVVSEQGDLTLATEFYRRSLAIHEQLAPDSLDTAGALHNLAAVALAQGNVAGAREQDQRALAIKEKLAPDSLEVASSLNNLGIVLSEEGDLEGANHAIRRALSLYQKLAPGSLGIAGCLDNLARLAGKQGNWPAAEQWARQAWTLVRRQAAVVTGDEARQGFGSSTASLAATLLQAQAALGHLRAAFETMEEGRAQALLQMLLERRVIAGLGNPRSWLAYQAATEARDHAEQAVSQASVEAARTRRALAAAGEEKRSPEELARLRQAFAAAVQRLAASQALFTRERLRADQLWSKLQQAAPRAFTPPLSLAQAGQVLAPGELYAAFAVGPDRTYLFCLRRGRVPTPELTVFPIAGSDSELRRLVQQFRSLVTDPESDTAETTAAGRALFARLFPEGARKKLQAARRLLLSPYGPLWDLSFAALVVNAQGPPRYLGETKPLVYTPSLTLLAQSRCQRPGQRPRLRPVALVVGDPVFERPAGIETVSGSQLSAPSSPLSRPSREPAASELGATHREPGAGDWAPGAERSFLFGDNRPPPRLPGTRDEAIQVARLYGSRPLLGEAATEAAVRREIGRADLVHLATHGDLNPYRPMFSGVLLAAPLSGTGGSSTDDGLLQAWEIHNQLKLKADLVVLSACETGRGANVLGEGIVGLTRSLEYAGARSVVASQWKVADASTRRLMVVFHQRLLAGLPKDESLRQAMTVVRRDPRTARPYYWAAFVLTGDPDNPILGPKPAP
jgi:CHAT domain-containing protein/Flp pilus assembly protein TadD